MESAVVAALSLAISKLSTVADDRWKHRQDLKNNLSKIKSDLLMLNATIRQYSENESPGRRCSPVVEMFVHQVKSLECDIEDCLDIHKDCLPPHKHRLLRRLMTAPSRTQFAIEIEHLMDRVYKMYKDIPPWVQGVDTILPRPRAVGGGTGNNALPLSPEADLVGLEEPMKDLLELLAVEDAPPPEQRRVISIVGCRGLGKTALARAVYLSPAVRRHFPCRAWLPASTYRGDHAQFLKEIYRQIASGDHHTTTDVVDAPVVGNLQTHCHLDGKRYLIVIDDVQRIEEWTSIQSAFPNNNAGSRIVVTTSVESVATTCSDGGSYLYEMKALDERNSKNLFWKMARRSENLVPPHEVKTGLICITKKCNGLPVGLVSIGNFMKSRYSILTETACQKVCHNLGDHLFEPEGNELTEMKRALEQSYHGLGSSDLKKCLLSVSIYPRDYQINRESMVRRWLAQGLVKRNIDHVKSTDEDVANDYFNKLVDQNVIQTVDKSNNAKVKTCQVHGVMLDFIVHKSVQENFLSLIDKCSPLAHRSVVRQLCLHGDKATELQSSCNLDLEGINLARVRSLSIFKHSGPELVGLTLRRCSLLRALDLEDCEGLKDSVLDSICQLLQLRYLSLRGTNVSKLPSKMARLESLETLDIRGTKVNVVPIQVLTLPLLAHLLGRFQLPAKLHRASRRLSENSKLHTMAGFEVSADNRGFEHIILCMKKLRKLKIWSTTSVLADELTSLLVTSLQKRFEEDTANAPEALSFNFQGISLDFLDNLETCCVLRSVKLRGTLTKLPGFIIQSDNLRELRLVNTGLDGSAFSVLQHLGCLVYLKLVEKTFGEAVFDVQSGGFCSIQRLCFKSQEKLPLLRVADEGPAMHNLTLLQLLCSANVNNGTDILARLSNIKEVTLDYSVSPETKEDWQAAARSHCKRPKISYNNGKKGSEDQHHPTANGHGSSS